MKENTCCFIGHRTIKETKELKAKIHKIVEKLIVDKNVGTFLFGSKSKFNNLCLKQTQIIRTCLKRHSFGTFRFVITRRR